MQVARVDLDDKKIDLELIDSAPRARPGRAKKAGGQTRRCGKGGGKSKSKKGKRGAAPGLQEEKERRG